MQSTTKMRLVAVLSSAALHVVGMLVLSAASSASDQDDDDDTILIDVAPAAPDIFEPKPDPEPAAPQPATATAATETEPEPAKLQPEPPEPDPTLADAPVDAGPPPPAPDAGLPDAAATPAVAGSGADGGTYNDAGTAVAGAGRDGGIRVASAGNGSGSGSDSGVDPVNGSKPDPSGSDKLGPAPPGADANFAAHTPSGHNIGLLIRFDRLRGTEWEKRTEAILKPMPDYARIIGRRNLVISNEFSLLMISSSDPNDVTATHVVGLSRKTDAEMRSFLSHPGAPVTWTSAKGGALGVSPKFEKRGDPRVYLAPYPGWVVLTRKQYLRGLTAPSATPIDRARAKAADMPNWLRRMPQVLDITGKDTGPAIIVSAGGLPSSLEVPLVGKMNLPRRLSLALEVDPLGFLARGTATFPNEAAAAEFVKRVTAARDDLVGSTFRRKMLERAHVLHSLANLKLAQRGNKVAFATSMSIADGRAVTTIAASWARKFYRPRRAPTRQPPKPRPVPGDSSDEPKPPTTPVLPAKKAPAKDDQ